MSRRAFVATCAAATAALTVARRATAQAAAGRWLLFTKSSGFEHDVIKRVGDAPSFLAQQLSPIFTDRGLSVLESKDGRLFEPESLRTFTGVVFYTTGDLTQPGTDGQPPMSEAGKTALFDAVESGMPFIGLHCASDTFHDPPTSTTTGRFAAMLGGVFIAHGDQQRGTARIVDETFPGIGTPADWIIVEEWYALDIQATDLRPIHALETAGMKGEMYQREPYPITWTRTHGKGRVFYTAIGHREDVINSAAYKRLVGGAIDWCRA